MIQPADRPTGSALTTARLGVGCAAVVVVVLLVFVGLAQARQHGMLGGDLTATSGGATRVFSTGQLVDVRQRPAPDFALQRLGGQGDVQLRQLRGSPVVLNFWASWCPPCRDEAPVLESAAQRYGAQGVKFVGIDVWDTEGDGARFLQDYKVGYPNVIDPLGRVSIDYGLTGTPETVFIDRRGVLQRKYIGPLSQDAVDSLVGELLRAA